MQNTFLDFDGKHWPLLKKDLKKHDKRRSPAKTQDPSTT